MSRSSRRRSASWVSTSRSPRRAQLLGPGRRARPAAAAQLGAQPDPAQDQTRLPGQPGEQPLLDRRQRPPWSSCSRSTPSTSRPGAPAGRAGRVARASAGRRPVGLGARRPGRREGEPVLTISHTWDHWAPVPSASTWAIRPASSSAVVRAATVCENRFRTSYGDGALPSTSRVASCWRRVRTRSNPKATTSRGQDGQTDLGRVRVADQQPRRRGRPRRRPGPRRPRAPQAQAQPPGGPSGRSATAACLALCTSTESGDTHRPLTCGNVADGWRWRWDLNPRRACTLTRFRGVLLRPLGHATAAEITGRSPRRPPERRSGSSSPDSAASTPRHDLGPVVEPPVAHDVPQRADRAGLGVVGAVDQPVDPGEHQGARAHRARLEGDHQRAAGQPPLAQRGSAAARSASTSAWPVGSPSASRTLWPRPDHLAVRRRRTTAPTGTSAGGLRQPGLGEREPHPPGVPPSSTSGQPRRQRRESRTSAKPARLGDGGQRVHRQHLVVAHLAAASPAGCRGRPAGRGRRRRCRGAGSSVLVRVADGEHLGVRRCGRARRRRRRRPAGPRRRRPARPPTRRPRARRAAAPARRPRRPRAARRSARPGRPTASTSRSWTVHCRPSRASTAVK